MRKSKFVLSSLFFAVMLMISMPIQSLAASTGTFIVNILIQANGGLYVGFTSRPGACAGEYKKAHGFINGNNIDKFDEYYRLLMSRRTTGNSVTITYEDIGNCTARDSLLRIIKVD